MTTESQCGGKGPMQKSRRYLVDRADRRTAVVLPAKEYQQFLEGLDDLAIIAERRDESSDPWETVKVGLDQRWQTIESR
jgi:hypothetical protein